MRSAKVRKGQRDTQPPPPHPKSAQPRASLLQQLNPHAAAAVAAGAELRDPPVQATGGGGNSSRAQQDGNLRKNKKQAPSPASTENGRWKSQSTSSAFIRDPGSRQTVAANGQYSGARAPHSRNANLDGVSLDDHDATSSPVETGRTSKLGDFLSRIGDRSTADVPFDASDDSEKGATESPLAPARGEVSTSTSAASSSAQPSLFSQPQPNTHARTPHARPRPGSPRVPTPLDKAGVTPEVTPKPVTRNDASADVVARATDSASASAVANGSTTTAPTAPVDLPPPRSTAESRSSAASSDLPLDNQSVTTSLPPLASTVSATALTRPGDPSPNVAASALEVHATEVSAARLDEPMMMSSASPPPWTQDTSATRRPPQQSFSPGPQKSLASFRAEFIVLLEKHAQMQEKHAQMQEELAQMQKSAEDFTAQMNLCTRLAEELFRSHGREGLPHHLSPNLHRPSSDTLRSSSVSKSHFGNPVSHSGAGQLTNELSSALYESAPRLPAEASHSNSSVSGRIGGLRLPTSTSVSPLRPADHDSQDGDYDDEDKTFPSIAHASLLSASNQAAPATISTPLIKQEPILDVEVLPSISEEERNRQEIEERRQAEEAHDLKRRMEEQRKQREKVQRDKKQYLENEAARLKQGKQASAAVSLAPAVRSLSRSNFAPAGGVHAHRLALSRSPSPLPVQPPPMVAASNNMPPLVPRPTAPSTSLGIPVAPFSSQDYPHGPSAYDNPTFKETTSPSHERGRLIRRRGLPADDQSPQAKKPRTEAREAEVVSQFSGDTISKAPNQEASSSTRPETQPNESGSTPKLVHSQPLPQTSSSAEPFADRPIATRFSPIGSPRSPSPSPPISIGDNPADNAIHAPSTERRLSPHASPVRGTSYSSSDTRLHDDEREHRPPYHRSRSPVEIDPVRDLRYTQPHRHYGDRDYSERGRFDQHLLVHDDFRAAHRRGRSQSPPRRSFSPRDRTPPYRRHLERYSPHSTRHPPFGYREHVPLPSQHDAERRFENYRSRTQLVRHAIEYHRPGDVIHGHSRYTERDHRYPPFNVRSYNAYRSSRMSPVPFRPTSPNVPRGRFEPSDAGCRRDGSPSRRNPYEDQHSPPSIRPDASLSRRPS